MTAASEGPFAATGPSASAGPSGKTRPSTRLAAWARIGVAAIAAVVLIGPIANGVAFAQAAPPLMKIRPGPAAGNPGAVSTPAPAIGVVPTTPAGAALQGSAPAASTPTGIGSRPSQAPSLNEVQRAWTLGVPGPQQSTPGIKRIDYDGSVVRVTTRKFVYTSLVLPGCEVISQVLLGDTVDFTYRLDAATASHTPARNRLDVLPVGQVGIDTTLTIVTESGRYYPFYLVATDVDHEELPDVVVQVTGARLCGVASDISHHVLTQESPALVPASAAPDPALPGFRDPNSQLARPPGMGTLATSTASDAPDYLRKAPVDVKDLDFDSIRILVPNEASRAIAPLRVYDDGRWTYVDFGVDRADSMRLPAVFVQEEGIDHLVNSAVTGAHSEILVVKAIGDLTLKSGRLYVCLVRNPDSRSSWWARDDAGRERSKGPSGGS